MLTRMSLKLKNWMNVRNDDEEPFLPRKANIRNRHIAHCNGLIIFQWIVIATLFAFLILTSAQFRHQNSQEIDRVYCKYPTIIWQVTKIESAQHLWTIWSPTRTLFSPVDLEWEEHHIKGHQCRSVMHYGLTSMIVCLLSLFRGPLLTSLQRSRNR